MEHIAPVQHPDMELDTVTKEQMRRPSVTSIEKPEVMERTWGFAARLDSTVTYEEYAYWAKIEREMEIEENKQYTAENGNSTLRNVFRKRLTKSGREEAKMEQENRVASLSAVVEETKTPAPITTTESEQPSESALKVTDAEWRQAARALRTASWGQMFFLITTDILGWSGAPYVELSAR